ncbi:MAG: DUF4085 family protein [Lysinibacillus sp.]
MFTLTNDWQMRLDAAYAGLVEEPLTTDDEIYYYQHLHEFFNLLPEKFLESIATHTLLKKTSLMQQFQQWCVQTIEMLNKEAELCYAKRNSIVERFSTSGQMIFSQSLHDADIKSTRLDGGDFNLLLDTSSGFTVQAIVQLTFHNAEASGILEGYYVYDELVELDGRFGLRVLSSQGYPFKEWTIFFDDVTAEYYYRPSVYVEPHDVATWEAYVAALRRDDRYVIVTNNTFVEIDLHSIKKTSDGIFAGDILLGRNYEDARERIYCTTYEDPYAHFSEEIELDELYNAVFGDDSTLKVRAFNTIFAHGEEVAQIVNHVLQDAIKDEDDMYFSIMASHFEKLGCLTENNQLKWCN